jgi:hypothetical protein
MANKKNIKVRDLKPTKDAKGGHAAPQHVATQHAAPQHAAPQNTKIQGKGFARN